MSKQPMQIKKAKADAPLWVPQENEMCEFNHPVAGWVRCAVRFGEGDTWHISYEYDGKLSNAKVDIASLREGKAPASKKDQLVRLMRENKWPEALAMAAKFQDLGEHKTDITKGHAAAKNPSFYRQLRQDPDALVAAGVAALKARYFEA